MPTRDEWKMYGRFASGLPGFLRRRIDRTQAFANLETALRSREASFLRLVKTAVFGWEKSPYLRLLRHAGCEFGDIEAGVAKDGIEGTLERLRLEGVYATFEEFKGRVPIVRGSLRFDVEAKDFDNPFTKRHYELQTGGSTGAGTRIGMDLEHLFASASNALIANEALGVEGAPTAIWKGTLPDGMGLGLLLRCALIGNMPERWFAAVTSSDLAPSLKYRLADRGVVSIARLMGHPMPYPEPLPVERAATIARWATGAVARAGRAVVRCNVSKAVRVSLAAEEDGLRLDGVTFLGGGEPPTEGKRRVIARAGARLVANYAMAELGRIGVPCGEPVDPTEVHLLESIVALLSVDLEVPGTTERVNAICLTGLAPTSPKIALNFVTDDFGEVTRRTCGCAFGKLGLTRRVSNIYSYRKLVGEGVTLIGSDVQKILEVVLPQRFGGSALDFQLREEEGANGLTQLVLVASPSLKLPEDASVIAAFLDGIGGQGPAGDVARATWAQAKGVRLERSEPAWTEGGKFLPLSRSRARLRAE